MYWTDISKYPKGALDILDACLGDARGQYNTRDLFWCFWGTEREDMTFQGWKIHIPASRDHAARIGSAVLPLLRERDIPHKFLHPARFVYDKPERPKFIAIYCRNSIEARQVAEILDERLASLGLPEPVRAPKYHHSMFGRSGYVWYRYGGHMAHYVVTPYGDKLWDERKEPVPSFIKYDPFRAMPFDPEEAAKHDFTITARQAMELLMYGPYKSMTGNEQVQKTIEALGKAGIHTGSKDYAPILRDGSRRAQPAEDALDEDADYSWLIYTGARPPLQGWHLGILLYPPRAGEMVTAVLPILRDKGVAHFVLSPRHMLGSRDPRLFIVALPPNALEAYWTAELIEDRLSAMGLPEVSEDTYKEIYHLTRYDQFLRGQSSGYVWWRFGADKISGRVFCITPWGESIEDNYGHVVPSWHDMFLKYAGDPLYLHMLSKPLDEERALRQDFTMFEDDARKLKQFWREHREALPLRLAREKAVNEAVERYLAQLPEEERQQAIERRTAEPAPLPRDWILAWLEEAGAERPLDHEAEESELGAEDELEL